jgi:hypothetical protein
MLRIAPGAKPGERAADLMGGVRQRFAVIPQQYRYHLTANGTYVRLLLQRSFSVFDGSL